MKREGGGVEGTEAKNVFTHVILRFSGEIGIKGDPTRQLWEKKVLGHVTSRLKGTKVSWTMGRGFLKVTSSPPFDDVIATLSRCFGLSSFSPAIATPLTIDHMKKKAEQLVRHYLKEAPSIQHFGIVVDTNLSEIDSMVIKNEVGAFIDQKFDLGVYLDEPDLPVHFDVRRNEGYLYSERFPGAGGLPSRVQGKVITLLSGGPDSTLAMLLAAKRGCEIIPVFFDFGREDLRKKAREQAQEVTARIFTGWLPYQGKMYVVPFTKIVNKIVERGRLSFAHIHLRRFMFKTAELIAEREGAKGIVTGEVIGEKSSQTLHNLSVTSRVVRGTPLLRPLAGRDKGEIFAELAELDGKLRELTHTSIEPCNIITSTPPSTKADLDQVRDLERRINVTMHDLRNIVEESTIVSF